MKLACRNQGLSSVICNSSRHFSTDAEQPIQELSVDRFLRPPSTALVYGRLTGIRKSTTRSDILNLLDDPNLSLEDVKVDYNRGYFPTGMLVQFPTPDSYDAGIRSITKKGRLLKLDKVDRRQWDEVKPYDGKAILLHGIPRNALIEDVERFLSGCQYDSSSISVFMRQAFPNPVKIARVSFPSRALAMHAFITKNRGFCLNNQILVEVLE